MNRVLITSDLHLTDIPKDAYRWEIFSFLTETVMSDRGLHKDSPITTIMILGDLADRKNNHSSVMVNQLVEALLTLVRKTECQLYILKGNHDHPTGSLPYWTFLSQLESNGKICFVDQPKQNKSIFGKPALLLPNSRDTQTDWRNIAFKEYAFVFMHQTVDGAMTSNGTKMTVEDLPLLPRGPLYYSGDIHVPQKCGIVTYIGSPYHVHFGDTFTPRVLILDSEGNEENVYMNAPKKLSLTISGDNILPPLHTGDMVKLVVKLEQEQIADWGIIREELLQKVENQGASLLSIEATFAEGKDLGEALPVQENFSPETLLQEFCKKEQLSEALSGVAHRLLQEIS